MGNYNPRSPFILGEEWVPIRDEDVLFSPASDSVELGHGFTLGATRQVASANFYINDWPPGRSLGQTFLTSIYQRGKEDQSGPIMRMIVPCNSALVSGSVFILGANTVAAVADPSDNSYVSLAASAAATFGFPLRHATYAAALSGKRILGVNVLYVLAANTATISTPLTIPPSGERGFWQVGQIAPTSQEVGFGEPVWALSLVGNPVIQRTYLGEIDFWWSPNSPNSDSTRLPWTYGGLARFDISSSPAHRIGLTFAAPTTTAAGVFSPALTYVALEILWCEENRIAYGGRAYGASGFSTYARPYVMGANGMDLYTPVTNVAVPILPAGDYTVTISSADLGDAAGPVGLETRAINLSQYPDLNGLRQLYEIPPHPGVQINTPFPMDDTVVGDVITVESTMILPQISLHATGTGVTLTEPHAYGRQAAAQVYGANTATQDIYDDISGVNAVYPQVRYYARRFGDTTIPLTLTGVGAFSGSTVAIAVSDFDALAEIIDGWREVTLRFASAPTMGAAGGFPAWTWSAVGETSGNRWEILAASAPAISGIAGAVPYNLVPSVQRLGTATYQPASGDTVELTWMPQGVASQWVSGATADPATDAVLIFSQDPPTVTGVSLTAQAQTVTGIGFDCGSLPCCIPSGIAYSQIQWSATSLPATGFGAYELQRFDAVTGGDFETIMLATNPALVSFNDYEARVGITSVYRIRALNTLNFAGAWSTFVSGAPPTPGVTGGCSDQTGALIFTSNAAQSGIYNAAYVMQWERDPTEDFFLPEADMVQEQMVYGRDGFVAFHGTERGLERFNRLVLLQAAAIDPKRLADARTIRDLAWAQLPYVCVRDDIGDRWFANVRVPNIIARDNRRKYMARLEIAEMTVCPYPVNP